LIERGFDVVGIDNDSRATFFGNVASTAATTERLRRTYSEFRSYAVDVRDARAVETVFRECASQLACVVHAAAQPSHDWAATAPRVDFAVNAEGTLNMLEGAREHTPNATFIFVSTNKVYGDRPNQLPLVEYETRLDLPATHRYYNGVDTYMSIDASLHSLFGVSKTAADLLVQEYGRYFGMPTACFRCGCVTGPAHAGAAAHGFLSYMMRSAVSQTPYTIRGYGGKQVRDSIHAADLVEAFMRFNEAPRVAAVYNLGGGRSSSCSVIEAISLCEEIIGRPIETSVDPAARVGDHRWWISDINQFQADYEGWYPRYGILFALREMYEQNAERWSREAGLAAE
jgi:CDP-paratose 2-epimerase